MFSRVGVLCLFVGISAQLSRDKNELLNWCLEASLHKKNPSKEDALHQQCTPWAEKACCNTETTIDLHEKDMYNFTLNHCAEERRQNLSDNCRQYFDRNNCFYECEPHIGLWVVKTKRKIASERFYKVPLCASDCDEWFEACTEDYTCAFNWPRNFKFQQGVNYCTQECITFKKMYGDAKTFCEKVWDDSWVYTPDTEPCIKMWFNGSAGNPNEKVAEHYIDIWLNEAPKPTFVSLLCLFSCIMVSLYMKSTL